MNFTISRRKFFGLFAAAAAAPAIPKPLMALAAPEVAPVQQVITSVSILNAGSGYLSPPSIQPSRYQHVKFVGNHDSHTHFFPGQPVYWVGPLNVVSLYPHTTGGKCLRTPAGIMVSPVDHGNYGWIQTLYDNIKGNGATASFTVTPSNQAA